VKLVLVVAKDAAAAKTSIPNHLDNINLLGKNTPRIHPFAAIVELEQMWSTIPKKAGFVLVR